MDRSQAYNYFAKVATDIILSRTQLFLWNEEKELKTSAYNVLLDQVLRFIYTPSTILKEAHNDKDKELVRLALETIESESVAVEDFVEGVEREFLRYLRLNMIEIEDNYYERIRGNEDENV